MASLGWFRSKDLRVHQSKCLHQSCVVAMNKIPGRNSLSEKMFILCNGFWRSQSTLRGSHGRVPDRRNACQSTRGTRGWALVPKAHPLALTSSSRVPLPESAQVNCGVPLSGLASPFSPHTSSYGAIRPPNSALSGIGLLVAMLIPVTSGLKNMRVSTPRPSIWLNPGLIPCYHETGCSKSWMKWNCFPDYPYHGFWY